MIDEIYTKIKKKRLKFAEINEKSLNPYIEYKLKKEINKKKKQKKTVENKEEKSNSKINIVENSEASDNKNIKSLIKDIKEPQMIKENENENEIEDKNLNIIEEINNNKNKNKILYDNIEEQISPISEKVQNFDDLDENINISEIQNEGNNIIVDIKNSPSLDRRESTDTIFSSHKNIKVVKNEDFKILKILGRGSYGKVCLVEYLPTHEIYAMKSLKKDLLIQEEKIESTLLEKEILETTNHPFIIKLVFCFQTEQRINFVMPFIPGGELFQHLKKVKHFSEQKVKLYAAQIAIAIQYLHDMGYIYRDLKPENILIDEQGYLRLTDFGLAKKIKEGEKTNSFCGTPEYLAPEVINEEEYDKNVDWWSYGILIYEMICGIPPFYLHDLEKMYNLIRTEKIKFDKKFLISKNAQDLITRLLEKKVENRLCYHDGIEELKKHPFFKNIDFNAIERKEIAAPFIPIITNNTDVRNFDEMFTNEKLEMSNIASKNVKLVQENQYKFEQFAH